jgi:soluble lytic murein transglycosylase-like protein
MESLRGYDGNLMLLDKVPGTTQERAAFKAKVEEISADLKINPNWLMAIINMETNRTFDHKIQNSIGATGLIQFMPRTAEGL